MGNKSEQKDKINPWRLFLSISFFAVPIIIFSIFWYSGNLDKIFYLTEKKDLSSLYRLLWCGFGSMWGFSAIAFYWRKVPDSPFPLYLAYYPFLLLVISLLSSLSCTYLRKRADTFSIISHSLFVPC
jgi:hypothetical protein